MKLDPGKTTMEAHGLNLGLFIGHNMLDLRTKVPTIIPASQVASKVVQKYLNDNAHRIDQNCVRGIVAVRDSWRNHTGGRVHLFVGLNGPIGECFQSSVLNEPMDYELKSKFFLSAISSVSGKARPWVGRIHVHPMLCSGEYFGVKELLQFIRQEHGYQNDVQQLADVSIYFLDYNHDRSPSWVIASEDDIVRMFSDRKHFRKILEKRGWRNYA